MTRTADGARLRGNLIAAAICMAAAFGASLAVGRYPIDWKTALDTGTMNGRVFLTLRLPRGLMALVTGFALGAAGSVYQGVFRNPLAAPDVIGAASGASAGAAAAILFLGGGVLATTLCAFAGGMAAVAAALALAALARRRGAVTLLLSGIVVNALFQSGLMLLKVAADPERELAAIEYWIMGSFASVTLRKFLGALPWVALGVGGIFLLQRQVQLLGMEDDEARMLGVPVARMRALALGFATLAVSAAISVTGLISFVGLLPPHIARLMTRNSRASTTALSGMLGGTLMLLSDVLARSLAASEVPVSVITSILGAPVLFWLVCRRRGGGSDE